MRTLLLATALLVGGCTAVTQDELVTSMNNVHHKLDELDTKVSTAATQPGYVADPNIERMVKDLHQKDTEIPAQVHATTNPNAGDVIRDAAPIGGPIAPYLYAGGIILSLLWGNDKRSKAKQAINALNSAIDGVSAALDSGEMTVTDTGKKIVEASVTVNSTPIHPDTNKLISVLNSNQEIVDGK